MKLKTFVAALATTALFAQAQNEQKQETPLEKEALHYATAQFDQIWLKNGDSYFTKNISDAGGAQWKNVGYSFEHEYLTEADKLNGIEWQGDIIFKAKAVRFLEKQDEGQGVKLSEWKTPSSLMVEDVCFSLKKINGTWENNKGLHSDSWDNWKKEYKKPDVSELTPFGVSAPTSSQPQPAVNTNLQALIKDISTKIKDGKTTEAALAPELAQFDTMIAAQKGAKTDEAAQIIYMKAMLYLQVFENNDKAAEMMKDLKDNYADTKYGKNAGKVLEKIAQRGEAQKLQSVIAPGKVFPDFAEKDLDGKPLSVGALKGKVVLVDFWATWCGPCRAELPNVIEAYKKYHAQGFEIIGVSLDSDRAKLDAFLKQQDGMTWPQFFDGEGWSNKLAVKYGVQSIPFTVLIGADGKIIGKDLRGELLAPAIANALGK